MLFTQHHARHPNPVPQASIQNQHHVQNRQHLTKSQTSVSISMSTPPPNGRKAASTTKRPKATFPEKCPRNVSMENSFESKNSLSRETPKSTPNLVVRQRRKAREEQQTTTSDKDARRSTSTPADYRSSMTKPAAAVTTATADTTDSSMIEGGKQSCRKSKNENRNNINNDALVASKLKVATRRAERLKQQERNKQQAGPTTAITATASVSRESAPYSCVPPKNKSNLDTSNISDDVQLLKQKAAEIPQKQAQSQSQRKPSRLSPVTGLYSNILDDYIILHKTIGTGHYGSDRKCININTLECLAVKSIEKAKIGRLDHLKREVSFLLKINHSGIMKTVDCYEDEDYVHIVTERYSGGELFNKIIDNMTSVGCFSEANAARIIKSVLKARCLELPFPAFRAELPFPAFRAARKANAC